ncbi:MAG: hypothetical protein IKB05_01030, partial [Alphaproteobacteria bacterium]|nr:hypothetical protein [Alphaproteobacteria bacterium]
TWGTSATATTFSNYITTTSTAATLTYYAGKQYTCSAGYYHAASSTGACSVCTAGNWCPGVTNALYSTSAQGLSSCSGNLGTGYTSAGGTADTTNTKCYLPVSAGYIRSGTSGTTTTACAAGKYKTAHNAYYGSSYSCSNVNAGCYADTTGSTTACPKSCSSLGGGLYKNSAAGSDAETDCYFATTAGKYIATKNDTTETDCEYQYYCPATTLYYPNVGNRLECPAYTDRLIAVADYPESYYDATFRSAYNITWGTKKSAITQCRVSYSFYNSRGNFVDTLNYNTDTGKYDTSTGTTLYYSSVNPGYYLKTKYSETYCNVSEGSTNRMYYREALPCPENSYCAGYATLPLCTSGDYNDTLGVTACSTLGNGYDYSAGGTSATSSAACYLTTTSGKFVKTANAAQETCTCGGYCPGSVKVNYGSTGGKTDCAAGKYNSSTGSSAASACVATPVGQYTDKAGMCHGVNCSGFTYQNETGKTSCKACPDISNSAATYAIARKDTAGDRCFIMAIYGDKNNAFDSDLMQAYVDGAEFEYNSAYKPSASGLFQANIYYDPDTPSKNQYVGVAGRANGGYYTPFDSYESTFSTLEALVSGIQTPVGQGYWSPEGTTIDRETDINATGLLRYECPTGYDDGSATASAENQCAISTSAGKFVKTANSGEETCTCGGYCPGSVKVNYGSTGGKTNCTAGTYNDGTGSSVSSACKTTSAGYYALAGSCSQTQVNANCWGGAGSKVACPNSCTSPYSTSAKGSDDANDCYLTTTTKNYVKTAGAGQTTCAAGTYCPGGSVIYKGGTVSGRNTTGGSTTCPAGSFCAAGVSAGTECVLGSYSAAGASACTACQGGKTTSSTGQTSCNATCSNASGVHTWATSSWSANTVSNLCTASKCNANTYYTATTGTNYKNTCTTCGSYSTTSAGNTSTTCACNAGYTTDGKVGGGTTTTSAACKLISDIACLTGQYLPAKATSCSTCDAGHYCPASAKTYSYSTSTQGLTPCAAGTYQPDTGKTSCVDASAGYYVSGTGKTSQTACTGATYQPDTRQSSCLTCPTYEAYSSKVLGQQYWTSNGVHDTKEGCQVQMNEPVADDTGDYDGKVYCSYSNTAGDYSSCWIYQQANSCIDGYYYAAGVGNNTYGNATTLKGNVCKPVESGYWSGADELTRTACATGLVTCGAGKCANEAADCGRILHAGNQSIYLRSAARTSPALNVKIGNQTFFGALSTSYSSALKVKNDGTTYSVVNDYQ